MIAKLLFNRTTLIIVLIIGLFFSAKTIVNLSQDKERLKSNFETILQKDSLEVAQYKFDKTQELESYIESNQELKKLLSKTDIKVKRIESILQVKQHYIDSLESKKDITHIVKSIQQKKTAIALWEDVSECASVKGNVTYENDSLSVNILSKEYNNNTVFVKSKGKRERIKLLLNLRLGKRKTEFTPESKCGTNEITIIDKDK